jgi:hypothetical protein
VGAGDDCTAVEPAVNMSSAVETERRYSERRRATATGFGLERERDFAGRGRETGRWDDEFTRAA